MTEASLVVVITWCLVLTIVLTIALRQTLIFRKYAKFSAEKAKKYEQQRKKEIDEKYNMYISLTPDELDHRLVRIFSRSLELASVTFVSKNDPDAAPKLYAKAVEKTLVFIGDESIAAIDRYYGKDYVIKWCELAYALIENKGLLSKLIDKDAYADEIEKFLT